MTIKPFYIEWEDHITREDVAQVLDKCVEAGAHAYESVRVGVNEYVFNLEAKYNYFGVDEYGKTKVKDSYSSYGCEAVLITIEQLDKHLGLVASNHHPHRDLMISYANDCTQTVEGHDGIEWVTLDDPCWQPQSKYRLVKKVTMSEIKAHFGENIKIIEE